VDRVEFLLDVWWLPVSVNTETSLLLSGYDYPYQSTDLASL
jgi:hypothetical protein